MDQITGDAAVAMWQGALNDRIERIPPLQQEQIDELLNAPGWECVIGWIDRYGYPLTSTMGYVMVDGKLCMSCAKTRVKLRRLREDPRCSVTVSNHAGSVEAIMAVTLVGRARVTDDDTLRRQVHELVNAKMYAADDPATDAALEVLNSMDRVVNILDEVERIYSVNGPAMAGID